MDVALSGNIKIRIVKQKKKRGHKLHSEQQLQVTGTEQNQKAISLLCKIKKKKKMDDFNKLMVNLIFPFNKKINDIRSVKSKLKKE